MKIKDAVFVTSVASADKFYKTDKPIIAVAGKSNVGKSSLINMLANRKKLAKTSVTPGRTRLINYFDFGEFILADLPGYGFARVSKGEKEKWAKTLDQFFKNKENIAHVFMLVDSRHDPTEDDAAEMMSKLGIEYFCFHDVDLVPEAEDINETNRRREKQMRYNKENGITPTQIKKEITNALALERKENEKRTGTYGAYTETTAIACDPIVEYMSVEQLKKSIERTKHLMEKAADKMEFIEAAQYRDEMFRLQELLKKKMTENDK